MRYILSVDLGKQSDPTAFVLSEWERVIMNEKNIAETPEWDQRPKKVVNLYTTRMIERPALGTSYTDIVDMIEQLLQRPELLHETTLLVDATGVGMPVLDMMVSRGMSPVGIWITGGDSVNKADFGYRVPKRDLVTALQVAFQTRRIKISRQLALAQVFMNELANFRVKTTDTGGVQYEAWRSSQHDDIVLAQAMIAWYVERTYPQATEIDHGESVAADWNPLDI